MVGVDGGADLRMKRPASSGAPGSRDCVRCVQRDDRAGRALAQQLRQEHRAVARRPAPDVISQVDEDYRALYRGERPADRLRRRRTHNVERVARRPQGCGELVGGFLGAVDIAVGDGNYGRAHVRNIRVRKPRDKAHGKDARPGFHLPGVREQ